MTETWLTPSDLDEYVTIPGYAVYRCDKGRGGGVCLYVRESLTVTLVNITIDKPEGVEDVWVSVQSRKLPSIIIGCLYRHPHSSLHTYNYITEVFNFISLRNKAFYVFGDFNCNILSSNNKMKQIINNNKLTQLIDKPTRTTSDSATLIDIIVTNKPELALCHDVVPCPVSDHDLVTVTLDISKPKRQSAVKTFRQLRNYSPHILCNLLAEEAHTLNTIFTTDNVDDQVNKFNQIFYCCLDKCAPLTTKEVKRPFAPWITDDLRTLIQQRNCALRTFKRDRDNADLEANYRNLKRQVKAAFHHAKSDYYSKALDNSKGNGRETWKILRELVPDAKKTKTKVPVGDGDDDESIKSQAEYFNAFFANVGKDTFLESRQNLSNAEVLPEIMETNLCDNVNSDIMFRPEPTTWETVTLILKHMKTTNSHGSDGIPLRYLRDSLPVIIMYLTCIINTSITTGVVPTAWKHSIIVPLFKSGDQKEPQNYRPISLLPIVSKVLEKVIALQLTEYLETRHLLSTTQHGFRSTLSTDSALLTLSNMLYENIDKRKVSLITVCDLSKGFDSVSHDILLSKCRKLNIDSFWFQNYLSNRTQSVRINNCFSNKTNVCYGVPQGSVLGPILFIIYVNDLSYFFPECKVIQYADDTQFIHTGDVSDIKALMRSGEESIRKAMMYFYKNGLMLNASKTQCMFVGTRGFLSQIPADTHMKVNGNQIVPSKYSKNLGIFFDSNMQFNKHIDEISRKIFGTIMYVNRLKDNFNKSSRITVIQSLVLSIITYGIKIWGSASATQIQRVQKLQNFAAKVALGGAAKHDHVTPYLQELGWLKVKEKYLFEVGVTVYNVIKQRLPHWLITLPIVSDYSVVNTRQQNQLYVPKCNTCMGMRSLQVAGPSFWNSLPSDARDANSLPSFKNRIKKHLQCLQFQM